MSRKIGIMVSVAGLALLGWANPASAQQRCRPSDEAGWISAVEILSVGRQTGVPTIQGPSGQTNVTEGAAVCANDTVVNPAGSRRLVRVRLAGGGRKPVQPGESLPIAAPSAFTVVAGLFNRVLGGRVSGQAVAVSAANRGSSCAYAPLKPEFMSYAVKEWGPLHVAWPCQAVLETQWIVSLTSLGNNGLNEQTTMPSNYVEVDISDCEHACMLMIIDMRTHETAFMQQITIVSADKAKLPRDLAGMAPGPAADALIGAVLSKRRDGDGWHLQGNSLLYRAGCDVPAAALLGNQAYGYPTPDEPCLRRDTEAVR